MDGTVNVYLVNFKNKWEDYEENRSKICGVYSDYEKALKRVETIAKFIGYQLEEMITDMMYPNWWWKIGFSLSIETITLDEDICCNADIT